MGGDIVAQPITGLEKQPWAIPVLRWAGSKRKLLPQLVSTVPSEFGTYIEPFVGSGCLFFALKPRKAILGDCNHELMECYSTIRDHPRLLQRTVVSMPDTQSYYYQLRDRMIPTGAIPRAARFVYLNRHCFNGVYRTNRSGQFNVPRGYSTGCLPGESTFYRCSVALRNAELFALDFEEVTRMAKPGDFVYLDPPYSKQKARFRGEYGYGSFSFVDVPRLLRLLELLDKRRVRFLLSYSFCTEIRPIMKLWNHRALLVRRHVAGFTEHRSRIREVLVANYELG